ncbi:hypothetical protein GCM10012280_60060 [Wenjunlia tyrosinilytica]|uniref:IgA peptidase M64 n=2 Tax=Wenjunlia tyrosinilytica TaxID=1544741 RepID=A0A917ZVK1_9ACTN|nr:hypothetical protein GCM10012280_60060 [Wenjunlia tyrosinilytica]
MLAAAGIVAAAAFVIPATANSAPASTPASADRAHPPAEVVEAFQPNGDISRVKVEPRRAKGERVQVPASKVRSIVKNGPPSDRFDIVFVADGYTASQMDRFRTAVSAKWKDITAVEPFKSYAPLFNVWAVEAVSKQSGISGDPTANVHKDTAVRSYFWCEDTERLLCTDTEIANAYARQAPAHDATVVLANTKKYGGAGYPSVSTVAGGNEEASQILVHEMGHSIGGLADEYIYGEEGPYTGPEPLEPNVSKLSARKMTEGKRKWYRWIGEPDPNGGKVGTFVGAYYHTKGVNRPTGDSIMQTLGLEFNLPSRESMIAAFYGGVDIADTPAGSPRPNATLKRTSTARITVPKLPAKRLKITWSVDGRTVPALSGAKSASVSELGLDSRAHTLKVKVEDTTSKVRDPELRKMLKDSVAWKIAAS